MSEYAHRLSDGTSVTVYETKEPVGDPFTAVLTGKKWARERNGDSQMLAMSRSGTGISQFTSGQVGGHLGRKLQWSQVPRAIQDHIVSRVTPKLRSNARASAEQEQIDALLGSPLRAQILKAEAFIDSFGTSTEALMAILTAMQGRGQMDEAAILESVIESIAELEVESM